MQLTRVNNHLQDKMQTRKVLIILPFCLLLITGDLKAQNPHVLDVDSRWDISPMLVEISGMACFKNNIYALNDGGNGPYIFKLDLNTGELQDRYRFFNIRNNDWEELSIYGGYLYIGDFGNNSGKRKDLAIYRISIDSLDVPEPTVEKTPLDYLLRDKIKKVKRKHEWDCEAMAATDHGLFCFSKNRKDQSTMMYRLTEGKANILSPVDSFNTGFLVTGAFYHIPEKSLFLCGYYENETYLMQFRNNDNAAFSDDHTKYIIPELKFTQVESLFVRGNYIYLASERTFREQAIYRIRVSGLKKNEGRNR